MVTVERPKRRSDDPRELRDRYNELCHALTQSAGTNSAVADRLLAELQSLAQQIAAAQTQAENDAAQTQAPKPAPEPSGCCTYRPSNVVAFRLKVKGTTSENPRLPAALSALTESYAHAAAKASAADASAAPAAPAPRPAPARGSNSGSAKSVEPARPSPAVATPPAASPPAAIPPVANSSIAAPTAAAPMPTDLDGMVARQGNEIEQLAVNVENAKQILDLLEGRLSNNPAGHGLAPDVAALRSATARQGQQLVALATAVHRLAKLLAAGGPPTGP
jgi:hypothetical protein